MRSYRHHFHAGNHADVLKHLVLMLLLEHLGQKETAFWFIDTHAGAGHYTLASSGAHAEWRNGIGQLWDTPGLSADLARFRERIQSFNPSRTRRTYPGSPAWARMLCRPQDRLRLFEWHPTDHRSLANAGDFRDDPRIRIFAEDGLAGLKALLPPPSRRALVLIDPPYENATEYRGVLDTLSMALRRFPTGVYALWYPELALAEARRLPAALERLPAPWLRAHLHLRSPGPDGLGLTGSGMFVLNPPWTLASQLTPLLAELTQLLGEGSGAAWDLQQSEAGGPNHA
jgi:23S rRNA (adenine2030-N6)-methyltransferase